MHRALAWIIRATAKPWGTTPNGTTYDGVGNILEMRHQTGSGGWRRCYQYAEDSNRLLSTSGPDEHQDFDKHSAHTLYGRSESTRSV